MHSVLFGAHRKIKRCKYPIYPNFTPKSQSDLQTLNTLHWQCKNSPLSTKATSYILSYILGIKSILFRSTLYVLWIDECWGAWDGIKERKRRGLGARGGLRVGDGSPKHINCLPLYNLCSGSKPEKIKQNCISILAPTLINLGQRLAR